MAGDFFFLLVSIKMTRKFTPFLKSTSQLPPLPIYFCLFYYWAWELCTENRNVSLLFPSLTPSKTMFQRYASKIQVKIDTENVSKHLAFLLFNSYWN